MILLNNHIISHNFTVNLNNYLMQFLGEPLLSSFTFPILYSEKFLREYVKETFQSRSFQSQRKKEAMLKKLINNNDDDE